MGLAGLAFPPDWIGQVVAPASVMPVADPQRTIEEALAAPVGSAPLVALVRPGQRVAILVDDVTRKTPVHTILPLLLQQLAAAGVARQQIAIVVALGTHRPMRAEELAVKLGAGLCDQYTVVNVSCTDDSAFAYLGETSRGIRIPAFVNRAVVDADLRIGVGMITPHLDAGWSGGAKIVLPGVCALATVDAFHRASADVDAGQLGHTDAPMRRTLERFVAEQVPLHFIVNAVLTLDGGLYACVAGDAVAAHRAGVRRARAVYSAAVNRRFPVVVADCAPYDGDLWQSIKGAWAGAATVAAGGTLLLVTAAPEGTGGYPLVPHYAGEEPEALRRRLAAGAVEDAMQAATGILWGTLMRQLRLVFVSEGLQPADAAAMGAGWQPALEPALAEAVRRLPAAQRTGSVALIPQAGVILPAVRAKRHEA